MAHCNSSPGRLRLGRGKRGPLLKVQARFNYVVSFCQKSTSRTPKIQGIKYKILATVSVAKRTVPSTLSGDEGVSVGQVHGL